MSACFVCSVLELPKKKKPNWKAARAYVNKRSWRELAKNFIDGLMLDISEDLDEHEMLEALDDNGFEGGKVREAALAAIAECENMWDGNSEGGSIQLSNCQILVAGESTYGDEPDGVTSIRRFEACGAAKAAGFLV